MVAWRRLRDWRAGLITIAFLAQYLPWFLPGTRPTFFFYVLPLVPFMVLAVVYLAREASDATIVVREPDTGEVAINPTTGEPAISTRPRLPTVRRRLRDRSRGRVRMVLADPHRRSDERSHLRTIVWFRWWI